ncbi:IS1182 family transposase [Ochrobactrum sp. BTU2]|uniref:IS1182 family transposase n=1 Tax=Ochrobactrum sp. BTU2 TaxID=2856166 RepID=UPI002119F4C7|nr:IS1182 family transposase [Ochrobactrum sp. BTU2]MCQ9147709.1 IS1182 family transposase [Ochrobactrum sp. BTU2]
MGYIAGTERGQVLLLPDRVEDYVATDAPVRVIDAFVDSLDMIELGFGRSVPASTGRPCYSPRDLLKLYIYGYFNEVRSSRRLERECRRNIETMWLMRQLAPDFKTIADFRRNNGPSIVGACRAFVLLCRDTGLFNARTVAIDGSKFRAVASPKKVLNHQQIDHERYQLDREIADYLSGLDVADKSEPADADDAVANAVAALGERKAELDRLAKRLEEEKRATVVSGEDDARLMGIGKSRKLPAYNVQTVVDVETGFIVHHEVTDEPTDNRMLFPMAKAAREVLEIEELTVLADAGYSSGEHATACEGEGIVACAPAKRTVNNMGDGTFFDRTLFSYNSQEDCFSCPGGKILKRRRSDDTTRSVAYIAKARDCAACLLKSKCTNVARRSVKRHFDEDALNRMNARATPEMMRKRRCSVEHPFGTIKRMTAGGRFLTRNLPATRTEMALSILAFNIMRATNMRARTR